MTDKDDRDDENIIDTIGMLCPMPIFKLRKALLHSQAKEFFTLIASDPASVIDVPHFCQQEGHMLLSQYEKNGHFYFEVKRASF